MLFSSFVSVSSSDRHPDFTFIGGRTEYTMVSFYCFIGLSSNFFPGFEPDIEAETDIKFHDPRISWNILTFMCYLLFFLLYLSVFIKKALILFSPRTVVELLKQLGKREFQYFLPSREYLVTFWIQIFLLMIPQE